MKEHLEKLFSRRNKKATTVRKIKKDMDLFHETAEIMLGNEEPYCWRAAWIMKDVIRRKDERLNSYISEIIKVLPEKKDGHQRELMKTLEKVIIPEDEEGRYFDVVCGIWETLGKSPSARITAFKAMLKIAKSYPELKEELIHLTVDDYTESLTPGVKRSFENMKAKFWG